MIYLKFLIQIRKKKVIEEDSEQLRLVVIRIQEMCVLVILDGSFANKKSP